MESSLHMAHGRLTLAVLRGADISLSTITDAETAGSDLSHASLKQSNLNGANLGRCKLTSAVFDGAGFVRAHVRDAKLRASPLDGPISMKASSMVSAAVNETLFLPRPRSGGASVRGTIAKRSRKCWCP